MKGLCSGLVFALALASLPGAAAAEAIVFENPLPPGEQANFVVVEKHAHRLILYDRGEVLRAYRISLGYGGLGPKHREGDGRTPEGLYRIDGRNPDSLYHMALHISYPSPRDVAAARAHGEDPGGSIMIHGVPNDASAVLAQAYNRVDWTAGCISVSDRAIEEIWRLVPDGTPIDIMP
jgi:murein L,D-transpeptidase YafK